MQTAELKQLKADLAGYIQKSRTWDSLHEKLVEVCRTDERKAGILFEIFCSGLFATSPKFQQVKKVYPQWEFTLSQIRRLGLPIRRDIGIDLLLEDDAGKLWAVQAKFKIDPRQALTINHDRLGNFGTASRRADYKVLISNSAGVSKDFSRQYKKDKSYIEIFYDEFQALGKEDLKRIRSWLSGTIPPRPRRLRPRPYQAKAISNAKKHFSKNTRGQLILPCGAGKTVTSLWISEKLNSKVTLICVPSLSLLKQTVDVWTHQSKGALEFRCVCSDSDVYQHASEDALVASTHNLGIPVTTSAKELLPFLRKRSGQAKVIFSTYQSLGVVGKALRRARACITLGIADEAHRTAGDAESDWRLFHEDSKVPIKYRLYMTATPRVVSPTLMKRAKSERIYLYCMDNEKDFGKPFFEMTFGQAIKQRILSDYRIVIAHSYSRRSNLGFRPNSKSQLSSSCEPYLLQE